MKERMLQRAKSPVSLTLILLGITLLISDYNFRWKEDQWKYAVHTDAADYYRYLPMVFIEQQFDDSAENPSVIKYFVGTALMYSPFFAVACGGSFLSGLPVDGYSMLFPILISIGTLFYFMFGLYYFSKFLKYYILKDWVICLTLVAIAFGTVAWYYTVNAPGWAHIAAFALVSFLLYHLKKISVTFNRLSIIAILAASSFLFFVRPTDIIILSLAPFFSSDFHSFIDIFKKAVRDKRAMLTGFLFALIPLVCQLAIYKFYTDEFFIWSYTKEGFDFLHPQIMKELFSYTKGFFVYTPICFLALFGLFRLFKINRYLFLGVVICLLLNIYIISSWWCWNYGFSYGPRAFIEQYPVFFFLLALLLDEAGKVLRIILLSLVAFFCFLNLFQTYQALNGILDQDYKTDKKGYWDVFLSTENGYSGKFYRIPVDESKENIKSRKVFFNDMEGTDSAWLNSDTRSGEKAHSGKFSSRVNAGHPYSVGLRKNLSEVPYNKNVLIRASGWFYVPGKGSDSYFAISFAENEKSISFHPFRLDGYTQHFGEWEYHVFEMYMPKLSERTEKDPSSRIEIYYFNNSSINCYVDDLHIEFIEFKKMERVLDLSWE